MILIVDDLQENLDAAISAIKEIFCEVVVIAAEDFSVNDLHREEKVIVTAKNYNSAQQILKHHRLENMTLEFAILDLNFPREESGDPEPLGDWLMCDVAYAFVPCAIVSGGYNHGKRIITTFHYMFNKVVQYLGQVDVLKKTRQDYIRCFQMLAELEKEEVYSEGNMVKKWGWQCPEFAKIIRDWTTKNK
jgi:hypothetical protein